MQSHRQSEFCMYLMYHESDPGEAGYPTLKSLHGKIWSRLRGLTGLVDQANRLGGSPYLSRKRDQIKIRKYMDWRVTPPERVTWGPPPPFKQALLAWWYPRKISLTHFTVHVYVLVSGLHVGVTNINFPLTISICCQEKWLWELIIWSPKRKCFDLLPNSLNVLFKEVYGHQSGEFVCGYWGWKGYMYSLRVFADLCSLILSCTKNHTEISTYCNSRWRQCDNATVCCHWQPQTIYHLDKRHFS